jgi:hypothetical protein
MLDLSQAERLVADLRRADRTGQPVDPTLPQALEHERREGHALFDALEHDASWFEHVSRQGLVGAGLSAVARWLKG